MKCQRPDCDNAAAYCITLRTPIMPAPAFYYECPHHAAEWDQQQYSYVHRITDIYVAKVYPSQMCPPMTEDEFRTVLQNMTVQAEKGAV